MAMIFLSAMAVAFSGAVMPGPLLTYTIRQALSRGPKSGFVIIIGHALLEAALKTGGADQGSLILIRLREPDQHHLASHAAGHLAQPVVVAGLIGYAIEDVGIQQVHKLRVRGAGAVQALELFAGDEAAGSALPVR